MADPLSVRLWLGNIHGVLWFLALMNAAQPSVDIKDVLQGFAPEFRLHAKTETIRTPAKDLYLGYPHGPKTAEFIPAGREAVTLVAHIDHPFKGEIIASSNSFACDDRSDSPLGASFGNARSTLYDAVYDRTGDWLISAEGGHAQVTPLGKGRYQLTTLSPCAVSLKTNYYRDHLGYFLWTKDQPIWPMPVAGWCSWAAYGQDVNEKVVREAADFFSKNLGSYGYSVIQIDDGYQRVLQHMDGSGPLPEPFAHYWTIPNQKFPTGLGPLAEYIAGRGMTPGIWVGYYLPLGLKNEDGYTKDPDGKPHKGPWVGFAMNGLMPAAREEAYIETVRELHAMGWRYFKIDTLRHILYDNYRKVPDYWKGRGESMEHAYRTILAETKRAIGDSYLLACWGTIPELAGIPNGCRIGEDVGPDYNSMRRTAKYIAQFNYLNNVVWRNDPDYMCFRVPIEQARAWATMNFLAGGQVMVSDPVSDYDAEHVDALRRVGPPILSRPMNTASLGPDPEFMLLNAEKNGQYWTIAARFAWTDLPAREVSLSSLGLEPGHRYLAFDFWKSRYLGVVENQASYDALPKGSCQVICFRPLQPHPQVLGTDRHLSQGIHELDDVHWNGSILSGRYNLGPGRRWNLFVHVPAGWHVSGVSAGLIAHSEEEVLKLTFPDKGAPVRWSISFRKNR